MDFARHSGRLSPFRRSLGLVAALALVLAGPSEAAKRRCIELLEPVTQLYASARPGPLNGIYQGFYRDHFGVNIVAAGDTMLPYLSLQNLTENAISAFLRPGEPVSLVGKFARKSRSTYLGHPVSANAKLVLVQELFPGDPTAREAIEAGLGRGPDARVVVYRRYDPKATGHSYLAEFQDPRVVEVYSFSPADTGLTGEVHFAASSPENTWKLLDVKQQGSQFFGPTYGIGFGKFVERVKPAETRPTRTVTFHDLPRTLEDPFENAPGFRTRDVKATFDLGTGQPNIPVVRKAGSTATVPAAKKEITAWYAERYGVNLEAKNIAFSQGVSSGLHQVFATLPAGTKVALPSPSYYVYHEIARSFGFEVVLYDTTAPDLAKEFSRIGKVDVIVTNFPHNPTGRLLDDASRAKLRAFKGLVVNDLSYPLLAFDGRKVHSLLSGASTPDHFIEILGCSKEVGLPEDRVAAIVGDEKVIAKLKRTDAADGAEISPLRLGTFTDRLQDLRKGSAPALVAEIQARRDYVLQAFRNLGWPESDLVVPEGGLNVLVKVPSGMTAQELTLKIWKETGTYVSPGNFMDDAFRAKNQWVRITLSENSEKLKDLPARFLHSDYRHPEFMAKVKSASTRAVKARGTLAARENSLKAAIKSGDPNALSYDVIVVGAGPASAVVAPVANSKGRVLYLSAGDEIHAANPYGGYPYFLAGEGKEKLVLFPGTKEADSTPLQYVPRNFVADETLIVHEQEKSVILSNTRVTGFKSGNVGYAIETTNGTFYAKRIILATGAGDTAVPERLHHLIGTDGFHTMDDWMLLAGGGKAPDLAGKRVFIVGGGDGALTVAGRMHESNPKAVRIAGFDPRSTGGKALLAQSAYGPVSDAIRSGRIETTASIITAVEALPGGGFRVRTADGVTENVDVVIWAAGRENPSLDALSKIGSGYAPIYGEIEGVGRTPIASTVQTPNGPNPDVLVVGPPFVSSLPKDLTAGVTFRLSDLARRTRQAAEQFFDRR
ncbi:MAG: aminotransferase class I/II-fold pyridoxal phosphate-dependent enzyme [Bdellovibrionales bacterium]|nr:aminotransferase class I/II-fold pyridoxal phosphate-dependent enzyme [Bdellovibrionales bacterium]